MAMRLGFGVSGSGATAADYRQGIAAAFVSNADGSVRAGLLSPVGNVVTSRASMGVNVAPFQAVLTRSADGALPVANDGVVVVALAAAPASNSRIDVVYVKHNDASKSDANSLPVLAVQSGTAAASPSKPSIPVGALELATVLVPAGAVTSQSSGVVITQTAAYTAAAGGVVPIRTLAELTAFNAGEEQLARLIGSDWLATRRSGAWTRADGWLQYRLAISAYGDASPFAPKLERWASSDLVFSATDAANQESVTINRAGRYKMFAMLDLVAATTGRSFLEIRADGTILARTTIFGAGEDRMTVGWEAYLAAGTVLSLATQKLTGGSTSAAGLFELSRVGA